MGPSELLQLDGLLFHKSSNWFIILSVHTPVRHNGSFCNLTKGYSDLPYTLETTNESAEGEANTANISHAADLEAMGKNKHTKTRKYSM